MCGLVVFSDNLFLRKNLDSLEGSAFLVGTIVGRVGRVIRRNNKALGLGKSIHSPPTTALPTNFHWSVGDQESSETPVPGSLGYVCTVAGTAEAKTETGTKATTTFNSTIIDVVDCTVFCQQQSITVTDETFSKQSAVRILRVIGLGHRSGLHNTGDPLGYPGKLIVEFPADKGVKDMAIAFPKATFQKISVV